MSGAYGYPQFGPQRPRAAVVRLVAAALLVVAAGLAVGGSFGAFSVYRYESAFTPPTTSTASGWGVTVEPAPETPSTALPTLFGVPLAAAAALALGAAVLLVVAARRPDDPAPARLLGVGAAGLLIGIVSVVWLGLLTSMHNVARDGIEPGSGFLDGIEIGAGGYLILAASSAALVAAVLLLVPRRTEVLPPGAPPVRTAVARSATALAPPGAAAPRSGWGPPPAWEDPPRHPG
ncbi:hypothetical protein [Pseudonocardia nigra]|uniref:hypothetical protein n=1 Tax=Pseudonocardia nigra TaxID=1921578 RepID=UPI001C5F36F7|nr:hypothetical protein [Pseudonocardia nigra]